MRSRLPKMLHPVAGAPMVLHVVDAVNSLGLSNTVVVVPTSSPIGEAVAPAARTVPQPHPLGTADALKQAADCLPAAKHILVVNGDMPLVRWETLQRAMARHLSAGAAVTIVTCHRPDARGLGRVLRGAEDRIQQVVEALDAGGEEAAVDETNEGIYCLDAAWAWRQLPDLPQAENGEYYLTSLVAMAADQGRTVASIEAANPDETQGVNDRVELSRAEAAMRARIRERLMLSGVTILDPASTFVDAGVEVGQDTVLHPNTILSGMSAIGRDCQIGPHTIIRDSRVGDSCRVLATVLEESVLESHVEVGPFSHLRPGTHIEEGVHLGNYVEVKNSRIGGGSAIGHFSYIGDATLGRRVNIGAGTITANYDGVNKHETTIGDDVFIGSDSVLVAPVTIADRAATGAGSVVTKDVPEDTLVVGVPARPVPGKKRESPE